MLDYEVCSVKMVAKYDKYGKKLRIKKQPAGWKQVTLVEFVEIFSREMVDIYIDDFEDYIFYVHETDLFWKGPVLQITDALIRSLPVHVRNAVKVAFLDKVEANKGHMSIINDNFSSVARKMSSIEAIRGTLRGKGSANYLDIIEELDKHVQLNSKALDNTYTIFTETGRVDITNVIGDIKLADGMYIQEDLTEGKTLEQMSIANVDDLDDLAEKTSLIFKDFKTPDLKKFLQFKNLRTYARKVDNIKEIISNGFGVKDVDAFIDTL